MSEFTKGMQDGFDSLKTGIAPLGFDLTGWFLVGLMVAICALVGAWSVLGGFLLSAFLGYSIKRWG